MAYAKPGGEETYAGGSTDGLGFKGGKEGLTKLLRDGGDDFHCLGLVLQPIAPRKVGFELHEIDMLVLVVPLDEQGNLQILLLVIEQKLLAWFGSECTRFRIWS